MNTNEIRREFKKCTTKRSINASNRRGYVTESMIDNIKRVAEVTRMDDPFNEVRKGNVIRRRRVAVA